MAGGVKPAPLRCDARLHTPAGTARLRNALLARPMEVCEFCRDETYRGMTSSEGYPQAS